jgi:uncharacterized protein YggE
MFKKFGVLGLTTLLLFTGAATAKGVERYVAVSATGSVKVSPDSVRINATTYSSASSSKLALSQTASASEKLRASLLASGITKTYIKSNAISVLPEYNYTQDKGSVLIGYKATQSFEVVVRKANIAGSVVDGAVNAVGDNLTIDGVTPFIFDSTKASAAARIDAVKRAKVKASAYARLLGVTLGKIIYLDESSGGSPVPIMMGAAKSDSGATVVDLGQQEVVVNIVTRWTIN